MKIRHYLTYFSGWFMIIISQFSTLPSHSSIPFFSLLGIYIINFYSNKGLKECLK